MDYKKTTDLNLTKHEWIAKTRIILKEQRERMFDEIARLENRMNATLLQDQIDIYLVLMGRLPNDIDIDVQVMFLRIVTCHVYNMYITF